MARLDDIYEDKFLRAAHLDGEAVVYTIESTSITEFKGDPAKGEGPKKQIVLAFFETEKKLGLNKTNANTIADLYGRDTDEWVGEIVVIYPTEVPYNNQMVDAIRVNKTATKKRNLEKQKAAKTATERPAAPAKPKAMTQAEVDAELGPDPSEDIEVPF